LLRLAAFLAAVVVVASATSAHADRQSDCVKGVAMIKAELKKRHPATVLDELRKALSGAEQEVQETDWSECLDHIKAARKALGR
jgi:uncharacterized membrane protein